MAPRLLPRMPMLGSACQRLHPSRQAIQAGAVTERVLRLVQHLQVFRYRQTMPLATAKATSLRTPQLASVTVVASVTVAIPTRMVMPTRCRRTATSTRLIQAITPTTNNHRLHIRPVTGTHRRLNQTPVLQAQPRGQPTMHRTAPTGRALAHPQPTLKRWSRHSHSKAKS